MIDCDMGWAAEPTYSIAGGIGQLVTRSTTGIVSLAPARHGYVFDALTTAERAALDAFVKKPVARARNLRVRLRFMMIFHV
jgi:hypothetical protein